MNDKFQIVGAQTAVQAETKAAKRYFKNVPWLSIIVLGLIFAGCFMYRFLLTKDPAYMDLLHCTVAPDREFFFGTDTMGRDIFSMIWYGGRLSLCIGVVATAISTVIAVVFGTVSGMAPEVSSGAFILLIHEILTFLSCCYCRPEKEKID